MKKISLQTKIVEAINAIDSKTVDPIVEYGDRLYYFNTRDKELGAVIFTSFSKSDLSPIETVSVRYGNHHTVQQVLFNPLPRKVSPPEMESLPTTMTSEPMADPTIILGFY